MGWLGRLTGKEKVKFPSSRDVRKDEARQERESLKADERRIYAEAKKEATIERAKAFKQARLERARKLGHEAGSTTWADRLSKMASAPPQRSSPRRATRYSTSNNYNPFGSMFDTGMDYSPDFSVDYPRVSTGGRRSKGSSKRYAVVGGIAYPVAGKKKKKRSSKRSSGGLDMFDNWGLM